MKRVVMACLSVFLFASLLCGCELTQPKTTEASSDGTDPQNELSASVETESTAVEETEPEVSAEPAVIVNNGGLAVRCGDTYYYWISENSATGSLYTLTEEVDGSSSELLQSYSRSKIYLSGSRIYINHSASSGGAASLLSLDLNDGTQQVFEGVQVVGVDDHTANLVVLESGVYSVLNTDTMVQNAIGSGKSYLGCSGGSVFFSETTEDMYSAHLWRYDLSSGEFSNISTCTADYGNWDAPGYGYSGCEIVHVQQTDQYIYYSYGYYGGTGFFFQSGGLSCVSKLDGTTRVLSALSDTPDARGPVFYVYSQDGSEYVRCYEGYERQVTICMDTMEAVSSDYALGLLGQAFPVSGNGYWISDVMDGQVKQILPAVTLEVADGVTYYCTNINYTGTYVFYDVLYQKENPNWTSWRDMTVEYLRESYRYDPQTGEAVLLCSTDL